MNRRISLSRVRPVFNLQRGFTLVEMVIVIIITSIIAATVAVFLRLPVQGYVDSVGRAELADVADTAVRRMTRDLRLALPNSIRVTSSGGTFFLELLLTRTGGRYLTEDDGGGSGDILDFNKVSDVSFTVVGTMPIAGSAEGIVAPGDQLVIYNLGLSPADAYNCAGQCNRAGIASVSGNTITLQSNPFAQQTPQMRSPGNRFQVVSTPVTYACNSATGTLTRYSGYTIQASQPVSEAAAPLSGNGALLASGVTNCSFSYDASLTNVRTGLVGVTLTLQGTNTGAVTLFHQVHVDNTP
jgi:MSHA biogenesis protein MshO